MAWPKENGGGQPNAESPSLRYLLGQEEKRGGGLEKAHVGRVPHNREKKLGPPKNSDPWSYRTLTKGRKKETAEMFSGTGEKRSGCGNTGTSDRKNLSETNL